MRYSRFFCTAVSAAITAAAVLGAPPTLAPVADEYTLLLYHFDESGPTVSDAGPLGLDADRGTAGTTEGRFKAALDTHKGAVRVPFSNTLNVRDGLTLEAWIRVDGPARDDIQRVAYRSGVYGLYLDRTGKTLTYYISAGGEWTSVQAKVPLGEWVHVAGTYDGQTMRAFINGEVKA